MNSWEAFGGDAVFTPLLHDFYTRIKNSAIAFLFPPDFEETEAKQFAFQSEFWGGPVRYSPWRGHRRLRPRHLPFAIDQAAADTWMSCMEAAVAASAMPTEYRSKFLERMPLTAQAMINRTTETGDPHPM